jgi:hypothetical protein
MRSDDERRLTRRGRISRPAYVLFASAFARDFYAAVPTFRPIPNWLFGPAWRFVLVLKGNSARRPCLCRRSAINALTQHGYYMFADRDLGPEQQASSNT